MQTPRKTSSPASSQTPKPKSVPLAVTSILKPRRPEKYTAQPVPIQVPKPVPPAVPPEPVRGLPFEHSFSAFMRKPPPLLPLVPERDQGSSLTTNARFPEPMEQAQSIPIERSFRTFMGTRRPPPLPPAQAANPGSSLLTKSRPSAPTRNTMAGASRR